MLIVFATILLFYMGPLESVVNTPLPLLWIIYNITGSSVAANVITVLLAVIFFFALFNIFASVSRLVWVFARDNGLPFSNFFSYVRYLFSSPYSSRMAITNSHPRYTPPSNCLSTPSSSSAQ